MNIPDKQFSMEQQTAIELCCDLDERIVGVTGGAGTGKTSVLGKVYEELFKKNRIALAAPTGRAAKRIEELTGIPATTIHRLLEFPMPDDPIEDGQKPIPNMPKRNQSNPLEQKIIIVDEASMIGQELYEHLWKALPRGGCLRMFGDNNQLAPVDDRNEPAPFIEILRTRPSIELTFNFRSEDAIVGNAMAILRGSLPSRNDRFEIIYSEQPLKELVRFASNAPEFATPQHQIIMPARRGNYGTMRVNPSLQLRFNPTGPLLRLDRFDEKEAPLAIRPRDKFLWTKNDYQLKVFNGETGIVEWVHKEDGALGLSTPDRDVTVPARMTQFNPYLGHVVNYDPRKQIELGYAITTHKSQGSEFETVVYCMCGQNHILLNRRNLYTAITRAKGRVIMITDRRSMGMSVRKRDMV